MSMMAMTAAGRELQFFFNNDAWLEIEETFGTIDRMFDLIDGEEAPLKHQLKMTAIIINAGLKKAGGTPDITPEWLKEHLSPKQIRKSGTMAKMAIKIGWKRENVDDDDDTPIDEVLAEIEKKKHENLMPEPV